MSQEQPRRPQSDQEPIKYGDVFSVSDQLGSKPIGPRDAAMMRAAECQVLGYNMKGGPASTMKSAADKNESAGLVQHNQITDIARDKGVAVEQKIESRRRVVTECVAGQVVGKTPTARGPFTIGDALEATAITMGNRPVDESDAAAITAAEMRATGSDVVSPGGVGAAAQLAAEVNTRMTREEEKTKLSDVLTNARAMLPADKVATASDAEAVRDAEVRNKEIAAPYSRGVADIMSAAARLNQHQSV